MKQRRAPFGLVPMEAGLWTSQCPASKKGMSEQSSRITGLRFEPVCSPWPSAQARFHRGKPEGGEESRVG